jgi:hypothetical protein
MRQQPPTGASEARERTHLCELFALMYKAASSDERFRMPRDTEVTEVLPLCSGGTHADRDLLRRRYVDSAPIRGRRHLQESLAPFDQHRARRVACVLLQNSERTLEFSGCIC